MDIKNLLKEAQKMQKEMENKQNELSNTEFFFESNGGAIKIKILGNKQILSIKIDEDLINVKEKELLEEMLMIAINEAILSIDEEGSKIIDSVNEKIKMPGFM